MTLAVQQEFRVGEVISQSFATTIRNIVPFGILAIIAVVIMMLLFLIVGGAAGISMSMSPGMMEPGAEVPSMGAGFVVGMIVIALLSLAIYMGLTAAITYGTVQDLRGQPVGIGGLLQSGISVLPPLLGTLFVLLGVLLGLMIVAAILALIPIIGALADAVLFIFIYVIFWVVIPVAVVERPGPVESLKRSVALTKGNRWRILGIILLLLLISIAVNIVSMILMFLPVIGWVLQAVLSAFVVVFSAVLVAVGYYRLRVAKEGADIGDIAKVFD